MYDVIESEKKQEDAIDIWCGDMTFCCSVLDQVII